MLVVGLGQVYLFAPRRSEQQAGKAVEYPS